MIQPLWNRCRSKLEHVVAQRDSLQLRLDALLSAGAGVDPREADILAEHRAHRADCRMLQADIGSYNTRNEMAWDRRSICAGLGGPRRSGAASVPTLLAR